MTVSAPNYIDVTARSLFNVRPRQAFEDASDGVPTYSISKRQGSSARPALVHLPQLAHIIVGKLRPRLFLPNLPTTLASRVSAFANHISGVLRRGTEKQVGRIHARRIVATRTVVADKHSFRDRAIMDRIRQTVCEPSDPAIRNYPITSLKPLPCPQPTAIGFAHPSPKVSVGEACPGGMVLKVVGRLPFGDASYTSGPLGYVGGLAAAAFAKVKGIEGKLYTVHVIDLLERLITVPRQFIAARGLSVPNYTILGSLA